MHRVFESSFHLAHKVFPQGGVCLEFGVHVGNSFIFQAKQIKKTYPQSTLIGFDSWAGLPEEETGVWLPKRHRKGEYASTKDIVLKRLKSAGMANNERIKFVDGFFSDSLTPALQETIDNVIYINIDVDIYRSTIELLDFVKPMLRPGVVLYWDDWKDPKDDFEGGWGEHLAWEKWSSSNPDIEVEVIETNPVNQRYMVVLSANGQTMDKANLSMRKIRYDAFQLGNPSRPHVFQSLKVAVRRGVGKMKKVRSN